MGGGGVVAGLEGFMFRGDRQERFGRWMGGEMRVC